jgi:hypothetical protein
MNESKPRRLLVVANETVAGRALIDAVKAHAERGPVHAHVICPQNQPKQGWVVYDESVRSAAENRLKTTLAQLGQEGIEADGEVMDPDPYTAIMDAFHHDEFDEIIVSTYPETRSGWMRRDLVDRIREDVDVPVEHIVVDLDAERDEVTHTLVVANQTVEGEPLFRRLKEKAAEGPHRFTMILPQGQGGSGDAHARLAHLLDHMKREGLEAVGQVMDPDPYTAIQNALQFYAVDDIVISTFPDVRSGWMREGLVERVEGSTSKPVEHVVVTEEEARAGAIA